MDKPKFKSKIIVTVVLWISAFLWCRGDQNDFRTGQILLDFESQNALEVISRSNNFKEIKLVQNESSLSNGKGCLQGLLKDPGGGTEIHPYIDFKLPESTDLSQIEAIECRIHIPEGLADHFFGRYDVRLLINGKKPRWSMPAINAGWNDIRWELRNLYTYPDVRFLRIQLGPVLPGFGEGAIHMDELKFKRMPKLQNKTTPELITLITDEKQAWSSRIQAIRQIRKKKNPEHLSALFLATADGPPEEGYNPESVDKQTAFIEDSNSGSQAVRSAAKRAIQFVIKENLSSSSERLRKIISNAVERKDGRIRITAIKMVPLFKSNTWATSILKARLLDNIYYIRQIAREELKKLNFTTEEIVAALSEYLERDNRKLKIGALRHLSEIGTPAQPALSEVLKLLRDKSVDMQIRQWGLRMAWWTDETVLKPKDWIIGLGLEPGEIHRHLLNRSMDRLTRAGKAAIPALTEALNAENPEIRARAATILVKIVGPNSSYLEPVRNDPVWYVRATISSKRKIENIPENPVKMRQNGNWIYFENELIEIGFDTSEKDPGPSIAKFPGGKNLIQSDWLYKLFSFDLTKAQNIIERVWFQKIRGVPMQKELQWEEPFCNGEYAELICRYPGNEEFPLEWEFHYVLRKGDPGFYSYWIVKNVSGKNLPESTIYNSRDAIGMLRQIVAPSWGLFDTAVLHDNFKWPAKLVNETDFSNYPDIYQATYRLPDGEVDAKHEGYNYELDSPVVGYCGPHGGIWQIIPSLEFLSASWPWNQRTGMNHNMFITAFEDKYYIPMGVRIGKGWEKIYGPVFYYLNDGQNVEAMWIDAKLRATKESRAWPYSWIDYNPYQRRGSVSGKVKIKQEVDPAKGWALLAQPGESIPADIEFGEWWRNVGAYHYVTSINPDGTFQIPDVIEDTYELFIWHPAVYGEFRNTEVTVNNGENSDVGECTLIPRQSGELLWQVGKPNRTMMEFRNGRNYHQWETYLRYRDDFPEGMHYVVGESNPSRDWNYLQPAIVRGENDPTTATIEFEMEGATSGQPQLTVVAGGRSVEMNILVNGEMVGELSIHNIGHQHIRTAPYGELVVKQFQFDPSLLEDGTNYVKFKFKGSGKKTEEAKRWHMQKWTNYIAYDFIRMEILSRN